VIADRRRVELVEEAWAKQPFHAAEKLEPSAARERVEHGVGAAHRIALREMRAAIARESARDNSVAACAVLVGACMPAWTVDEILSVHFRLHKAEGVLFRDVLLQAASECGVRRVEIPEKELMRVAAAALDASESDLARSIALVGKSVGAPWGKDQKDAALAARVALSGRAE
jgi:hypothetical protein